MDGVNINVLAFQDTHVGIDRYWFWLWAVHNNISRVLFCDPPSLYQLWDYRTVENWVIECKQKEMSVSKRKLGYWV